MNRVPSAAIESNAGVLTAESPFAPACIHDWSSLTRIRILGDLLHKAIYGLVSIIALQNRMMDIARNNIKNSADRGGTKVNRCEL